MIPREKFLSDPQGRDLTARAEILGDFVALLGQTSRDRWEGIQAVAEDATIPYRHMATCKAGCSACCTAGQIPVNAEEVRMLLPYVSAVAWERVEALRGAGLKERDRLECPLLDPATKMCTVYEHRPTVCRSYLVATPPERCDDPETHGDYAVIMDPGLLATGVAFRVFRQNPFHEHLSQVLLRMAPKREAL
jgi:Fe-S-cluster containining protein